MDITFVIFIIKAISKVVFAAGWYITAFSFFIQLFKIIKSKQAAGISEKSYRIIGFLNINSVLWLYLFDKNWHWSLPGAALIVISSFLIVYFVRKYNPKHSSYEGYIFDLDGTIFDTQTPVHAQAEAAVLMARDIIIDPSAISKKYAGRSTREVFKELAPDCDPDQLVKEKWEMIRKWLQENNPEPLEHIIDLIVHLKLKGIPIAIASASPGWYIEALLNKPINTLVIELRKKGSPTLLREIFGEVYISAEDVPNPKPAPDVFLAAAKLTGVNPKDCLVIGDGKSDVHGGIAAGMNVLFLGEEDDEIRSLPKVKAFSDDKALYDYLVEVDFRKTF
jgi:beta-phosphoglucomutase-like phosphatase (HAD superfamily)